VLISSEESVRMGGGGRTDEVTVLEVEAVQLVAS
jgi:hypothetical protein